MFPFLTASTIIAALLFLSPDGWAEPHEEFKLVPQDGSPDDRLGTSISASKDTILIGSPNDDAKGTDSGSAYLYRYGPLLGTWNLEDKLLAADGKQNVHFGWAVSLSDDVAVVAAPFHNDLGYFGSVYVYRFDQASGTWTEENILRGYDNWRDDLFGYSLCVDGDTIVIGTPFDDDEGTDSGSVYIYGYDSGSGTWNQEAKLHASDATGGEYFGLTASICEEFALIGAPWDDSCGYVSGAAYVFRYDPASAMWKEEAKLTPSNSKPGNQFGIALSLSDGIAAIGAGLGKDDSGSVYIFRYDPLNNTWNEETELSASDGLMYAEFGDSVAAVSDMVLVGDWSKDVQGDDSGAAYLFQHDGATGNWEEYTSCF